MFPLDPRTAERLAAVIVDADGPHERWGWQLEQLLVLGGWPDPPEWDGSYRVPWLRDQLVDRQQDRVAIERLICRVCDPLEYDEGMPAAELFRQEVNRILEPEQLVISRVGGRPVLGELTADGSGAQFTEPPDLERRIGALVTDDRTVTVLNRRLAETRICQQGGAHTLAIISIGSVVEGLLLALLIERDADARSHRFVDREGRLVRKDQPSLEMLIDTVHVKGWIQLDAKRFMHEVRDFRNFIHPRKELAEQPEFDSDSVGLCWSTVKAMLNDLEAALEPEREGNLGC